MPLYRVNLHGKNVLLEMDGVLEKYGFFTFREVVAADPDAAEYAAMQMLREHQGLRTNVKNAVDDPPTMHLEGIIEIEVPNPAEPGLALYPERTTSRWWQIWRRWHRPRT